MILEFGALDKDDGRAAHCASDFVVFLLIGVCEKRGDVEIAPYIGIFLNFLLKLKPAGHLKLALLPSLVGSTSNLTGIFSCSSRTWEMMPMMRP